MTAVTGRPSSQTNDSVRWNRASSVLLILWNLVIVMHTNVIPSHATPDAAAFLYHHRHHQRDWRHGQPPSLSLTTALEWLAEQRYNDAALVSADENNIGMDFDLGITWIDPSYQEPSGVERQEAKGTVDRIASWDEWIMPLYPLDATYLPAGTNHTLNNVEPRNIQMALDLLQQEATTGNPRFCAVLRAVDTGRIATVGTVLQILDAKIQYNDNYVNGGDGASSGSGSTIGQETSREGITRIQLTCRTCTETEGGLVEIIGIENPKAASRESRLRRSPEYLRARVRPLPALRDGSISPSGPAPATLAASEPSTTSPIVVVQQQQRQLGQDWDTVKIMYSLGIGSHHVLPPNALSNLAQAMPSWSSLVTSSSSSGSGSGSAGGDVVGAVAMTEMQFWNIAEAWQSVCCTIREGYKYCWLAERNEQMVAAAMAAGGPLKLPVHMEDLSLEVRKKLQHLEVQTQERFWQRGLDPCLDFQTLLTLPTLEDRITLLTQMVGRERSELENMASQYGTSRSRSTLEEEEDLDDLEEESDMPPSPPRKGAWFD
jgi:hypothetical protein